jgi:hypothetical protein
LPSVPTSFATRDTSPAKPLSCATMVFTIVARRSASPLRGRPSISNTMLCDRSPFATEPMTRATSLIWCAMSDTRVFMDSITSAQPPVAPGTLMRWLVWPSLPTCSATRAISAALASSSSTTSLNACAISPSIPVKLNGMRTLKSPRLKARSAFRSSPRSSINCRPGWMESMCKAPGAYGSSGTDRIVGGMPDSGYRSVSRRVVAISTTNCHQSTRWCAIA